MEEILSKENSGMINLENKIQEEINYTIKEKQNFKFEAGAGSGKTYALKESLKYILKNHSEELNNKNQKILCITYTNTAKDEISKELEYNSLIKINTIHEFIWGTINSHQNLLITEHAHMIKRELEKIESEISELGVLNDEKLAEISASKNEIEETLDNNTFKDIHYLNLGSNATNYREAISKVGWKWDKKKGPLSNIAKFRSFVNKYYKHKDLTNTKIDMIENKSKKIKYMDYMNQDRLHYYEISHDTVLKYGFEIIKKYPLIQKKVIDAYPYILIDEYQDTNIKVIKLLKILSDYSQENNFDQVIGFFGDSIQSIYSDGVGENIDNYFSNLNIIEKEINRRSCKSIIDISNKIRDDGLEQKSIYEDSNYGEVKIKALDWENLRSLSDIVHDQFELFNGYRVPDTSRSIDKMVMMTKHGDLAQLSGFGSFYKTVSSFVSFQGTNFRRITSDFLTKENKNLDNFFRMLNEIIVVHNIEAKTLLSNIVSYDHKLKDMTYLDAANIIKILKKIKIYSKTSTLEDLLKLIFKKSSENKDIKKIYQNIIPIDKLDWEHFEMYINQSLIRQNIDEDDSLEGNKKIQELLQIRFKEINCWFEYRNGNYNINEINYTTMHSSKGTEFNNVILVLDDSFSMRRNYFSYFFENYGKSDKRNSKFMEARNLLYVACSRARINLTIIIPLEMYSEYKSVIDNIFNSSSN